jgi:hypothetical protein
LAPIIERDVQERLIDSFRRPLASPLVMPHPVRLDVGRSENGANSAAVWP